MKNIITASIVFSFKGERLTPSVTIDLNKYMRPGGYMPALYPLIANENNIDLYSYEYEMMQTEPVKISHAEGLVADHVNNGELDIEGFERAWHDQQIRNHIQIIVDKHAIEDALQQYPVLENVFLDIYRAGQKYHKN